jgi:hypothetical protein
MPIPIFQLSIALYLKKEKLISGGVALSLLDYTANHFFQMRIGMSNDLLLPLDEVISPLGHSDFLSPLSVLPLYLKMWERNTHQAIIRSGRIIVSHILRCGNFVLLSASLGLM